MEGSRSFSCSSKTPPPQRLRSTCSLNLTSTEVSPTRRALSSDTSLSRLQSQHFEFSDAEKGVNGKWRRFRSFSRSEKIFDLNLSYAKAMVIRVIGFFTLWMAFTCSFSMEKIYFQSQLFWNQRGLFSLFDHPFEFQDTGWNEIEYGDHALLPQELHSGFSLEKYLKIIRELPSLNLLDYDDDSRFPVFHEFPLGLERRHMPQLAYNRSAPFWAKFRSRISKHGGRIRLNNAVDLRTVHPLQREISGDIVYNVLLPNAVREIQGFKESEEGRIDHLSGSFEQTWFNSKIVLVKSPSRIASSEGGFYEPGEYFILDGHHTTYMAAKICASPHSLLRLGNIADSACGSRFDVKQDVYVIEGLDILSVRELAIKSGADVGFGMSMKP